MRQKKMIMIINCFTAACKAAAQGALQTSPAYVRWHQGSGDSVERSNISAYCNLFFAGGICQQHLLLR
jgi:hypothetical protein